MLPLADPVDHKKILRPIFPSENIEDKNQDRNYVPPEAVVPRHVHSKLAAYMPNNEAQSASANPSGEGLQLPFAVGVAAAAKIVQTFSLMFAGQH